ncbi:hypothetical protein GCM10023347_10640 [Streptomyces chumphonensis]
MAGTGGVHPGPMLWSDPPDRPPESLRAAQAQLRRAGWVLAAVVLVVTIVLGLR